MKKQPIIATGKIKLARFDPAYRGRLPKKRAKHKTGDLCRRIGDLQELLYANSRHAILLLFQGMDASGKDGAIRTVLHHVNPAGVETTSFKVPSAEENAHDFLWRVHKAVPRRGNFGIFNRSHYEAVLVERVQGGLSPREVKQRFRQIIDFERMLVENRVILLKFYLHLGRAEQAKRLRERLTNPRKNWKFSATDLVARKQWSAYQNAYEDMLTATSHRAARWHIVPANRNWVRNYVVAEAVDRALRALRLKWPKPAKDLSRVRVK